jgi:hypothetical protein
MAMSIFRKFLESKRNSNKINPLHTPRNSRGSGVVRITAEPKDPPAALPAVLYKSNKSEVKGFELVVDNHEKTIIADKQIVDLIFPSSIGDNVRTHYSKSLIRNSANHVRHRFTGGNAENVNPSKDIVLLSVPYKGDIIGGAVVCGVKFNEFSYDASPADIRNVDLENKL